MYSPKHEVIKTYLGLVTGPEEPSIIRVAVGLFEFERMLVLVGWIVCSFRIAINLGI